MASHNHLKSAENVEKLSAQMHTQILVSSFPIACTGALIAYYWGVVDHNMSTKAQYSKLKMVSIPH